MWPFSKTKEEEKPVIDIKAQTAITTETEKTKSFFDSKAFIKAKGVGKIAFGALVLLQPHYAFLIGASICSAWVLSSTIEAVRDPENKGTLWEKIKNSAGKEAGVMIGLLAPYVGIGIAALGGLSYLSNHAEGAQGFFQGGVMATAVGTFGLPILGCAFVAEGLINSLGYEANFMAKGYSFAKGLYNSAKKVITMAEKSPDNQKSVIQTMHNDAKNTKNLIAKEAEQLKGPIQEAVSTIASNAKDSRVGINESHGMISAVKSFFFREKVSGSRVANTDRNRGG